MSVIEHDICTYCTYNICIIIFFKFVRSSARFVVGPRQCTTLANRSVPSSFCLIFGGAAPIRLHIAHNLYAIHTHTTNNKPINMDEASLLLQRTVATSLFNIDSSRSRNTSLDKRKEGWTEIWGAHEAAPKEKPKGFDWEKHDADMISG